MKKDFVVILNDLPIECNKEFISTNFQSLFSSTPQKRNFPYQMNNQDEAKEQVTLQIEGGNNFYDVTKKIFQGDNYDITNDNYNYLIKLCDQLKSDNLQTKLNSFSYQQECDENHINQHPSIQFLVEISSLIHKLNLTNYEDISSQLRQKIGSPVFEKKNYGSIKNQNLDESDNSNSDQDDSNEKEEKELSLKKIGEKELIKLFFYEIISTLSTGFSSIKTFSEHKQKIDLILQLIKLIDQEYLSYYGPDFQNILMKSFINFIISKYTKIKNQKSSITNHRQEILYLIHNLLSNGIIKLSQIHQEDDNEVVLNFLEFYNNEDINNFFNNNQQTVEFLEKEMDDRKEKSKTKKSKDKNDNKNDNLVKFLSKTIKEGLIQNNQTLNILLNDDIGKFNELYNDDLIGSFQFPSQISSISCLSALNNCSLLELSAFFGSQNIFEYLKNNKQEITKSTNLPFYVISGQQPQIINQYLSMIDLTDKSLILKMLKFSLENHFYDIYDMIYSTVKDTIKLTFKELDEYMKKCVSRGYFDLIPNLLKEGSSRNVLLNLFCKYNNEIGIEYMLEFDSIDVNEPYKNIKPLEYCINNKNSTGSILLLKNDFINIQSIDENKDEKLIHTVCRLGLSKVVSYLLSKHLYSANLPTKDGICPIHFACESGDYDTVLAIIRSQKVNLRVKVKTGQFAKRTVLHFACNSGNSKILTLLIDSDEKLDCDELDNKNRTPVIYAIKGDHVDCVRTLIEQEDFDINQEYKDNNLLQYACLKNKNEVFDLLLDAIIFDPNQPCSNGNPILIVAILNNNIHIVTSILKKYERSVDINIYNKNGQTPLIIACELGEFDIVQILLDQDLIKVNKAASDGETAFIAAVKSGNIELLKLLMDAEDINIYAKNKLGLSALHYAFLAEQDEVIKFLLPLFSDKLNETASNGETLLQIACKKGNVDLAKILINHPNVDVNIHDNEGMSPFLFAVQKGNLDLIKALIESKKCNINEKTKKGDNAFLIAVQCQNLKLIKFFIDLYSSNHKTTKRKGKNKKESNNNNNDFVDINAKNREDMNALFIALKIGDIEILKELVNSPFIDINNYSNERTFLCALVKILSNNKTIPNDYGELLDLVLNRPDIDVNEPSPKYNNLTCLHIACKSSKGNIKLINKLLNIENIDINAKSKEGTPLFLLICYQAPYFKSTQDSIGNPPSFPFNNNNNTFGNPPSFPFNNNNSIFGNPPSFPFNNNNNNTFGNPPSFPFNNNNNTFGKPPSFPFNNNNNTFGKPPSFPFNNNNTLGKPLSFAANKNDEEENENENEEEDEANENEEEEKANENENEVDETWYEFLQNPALDCNEGGNPRYIDASNERITALNRLLQKNTDTKFVNEEDDNSQKKPKTNARKEYETPLGIAIKKGLFDIAGELLKLEKIDINSNSNSMQRTPLHLAILSKNINIINQILSNENVDINIQDKDGKTPLLLAIDEKDKTLTNIILKILEREDVIKGINLQSISNGITPFLSSLSYPDESVFDALLKFNEVDFEAKDNKDRTAIYLLVRSVSKKIKISKGDQDQNQKPRVKRPLFMNQFNEQLPTEALNVGEGSEINILSRIEKIKSKYEDGEISKFVSLLNHPKNSGKTPLFRAIQRINRKLESFVEYLLNQEDIDLSLPEDIYPDKYNDPSKKYVFNTSLLHMACSKSISSIVKLLIPLTINFNEEKEIKENLFTQEDVNGNTILNLACKSNDLKTISVILNYVMDPNNHIDFNDKNEFDINKQSSSGFAPLHTVCNITTEKEESLDLLNQILSIKTLEINSKSQHKFKTALHYACDNNNNSIVDILISNFSDIIDPNVYDNDGLTPLLIATNKSEYEIINSLLKLDSIDLNSTIPLKNKTPFFIACEKWDTKSVQILINDSRTNINCQIMLFKMTPLMHVIESNKNDLFEIILSNEKIDLDIVDSRGLTALHYACQKGILSYIKGLIARKTEISGPNISSYLNAQSKSGMTPLHYVCKSNNNESILFFLGLDGVDVSIKDNNNQTAFDVYITNHTGPISEEIYKAFSNQENIETNASLQELCEKGHFEAVKFIISNILFDINNNDYKDKMTLLHILIKYQREDLIKEVIEIDDIDINQVDINQMTPLHYAVKYGRNENIVKILLETNKCDINAVDKNGCNVLHYAISLEKFFLINELLNYKDKFNDHIDVNARDKKGNAPLHEMAKLSSFDHSNLEMLLNEPVNINITDNNGNTPLHVACMKENSLFVQSLIDLDINGNIDINIVNKKHQTPLFIVCMKGNFQIFDILFSSKLKDQIDINLTSPIYIAAYNQHFMIVKRLIEMEGIDFNSNKNESHSSETSDVENYIDENNNYISNNDYHFDFSGLNLLHIMSKYNSTELLKKIIEFDPFDINELTADYVENKLNGTALIIALKNNQIKNFYLLIEHYKSQLDLSLYDNKGLAAIHYCLNLDSNSINILHELIRIDNTIINMKTKDKKEETALMIALQKNKIDCTILLLQQPKINVLCQSSVDNSTIVHFAAGAKRQDIINLVLNKIKTNENDKEMIDLINATNDKGETALLIACKNENVYVVQTLIDTFKDSLDFSIADNNGITPFIAALNTTNNELIHLLLLNDNCMSSVDLSVPIFDGNNYAIHLITMNSELENFKLLLSQVANHSSNLNVDLFTVKNDKGETVVDIAIKTRKDDIFNYICDTQNPDFNIMVENTPLVFYAVKKYDFRIFNSIVSHGNFDLNRKFEGKTLLHYACETVIDPNEKVTFLVNQPNIDVNCVTAKGELTPLHIAVRKRKVDVIETLLGLGDKIDYNKTNSNGSTPYNTAPFRIRKIFDGILKNS